MSTLTEAAKALIDSVEFDADYYVAMGQGGNGGLISPRTIEAAGVLRRALSGHLRSENARREVQASDSRDLG